MKMISWLKKNAAPLAICGLIAGTSIVGEVCLAASLRADDDLPWNRGVPKVYEAMTGPIPKAVSVIGISGSGLMYVMGQNQFSQGAVRGVAGVGVLSGTPSIYNWLSGGSLDATGATF